MNARRFLHCGPALAASAWLLAAGCGSGRYGRYSSPERDFSCEIPSGWSALVERSGGDFLQVIFVGPFEPDFFRGRPSFGVRWYAANVPHRLPDGSYEIYSSTGDFRTQMLREVYGRGAYTKSGADLEQEEGLARNELLPESRRVRVSGREAVYFVVYRNLPAPAQSGFGVVRDGTGARVVRERHGYALLPMEGGFYVLSYPATRESFEKYRPAFFRLINTFRATLNGPQGRPVS